MYISNETDKDRSGPIPSKGDIDLEAVRRALDRQAEEKRLIPAVFWVVVSPALLIFIVLIVSA
ncbi:hypothetical protein U5903_20910 [Cereibacter johrii]|uniref:hypothetical protein n=1 Tax=Cereibacter johrii TaxID=445629 RepID=UPI002B25CCCE|nr:hypothetical protein [Cereibacter johrii]MEA5163253.1 hypothetical protein [Cereibacter johrii]